MSQHDLSIANQGFPAFRSDLNDALQALGSLSSGDTAPSTTYANQLWYDSANNILKMRNEDDDAWISIATLDQTADTLTAIGSLTIANAATLSAAQTFTAGQRGEVTTVTYSATPTINFADSNNFVITLTGNATFSASNMTAGQSGHITIIQDGTGGRTGAWSGDYEFIGGTAPTLSTAASAVDVLPYYIRASGSIVVGTILAAVA